MNEPGKRPRGLFPALTEATKLYRPLQPLLPLQELLPALSAFSLMAFMCASLIGTARPPLPLQEFFPAQPLSPLAQPPIPLHSFFVEQECLAAVAQPPLPLQAFLPSAPSPLHSFRPLQTCFSAALALASGFLSSPANALLPAIMPAATAPITLVNSLRSIHSLLVNPNPPAPWSPSRRRSSGDCPYAPFPAPCQGDGRPPAGTTPGRVGEFPAMLEFPPA